MKTFYRVEILFQYEWFPLSAGYSTEADAIAAVKSFADNNRLDQFRSDVIPHCFHVVPYEIEVPK